MKKTLLEEIRRMSELAGIKLNENLINEATNKIDGNDGIVILVSDFAKNHIMTHNKIGVGSIFKSGINEAEIIKMVTQVAPKVSGEGGAYELNQSGIGYDLVLPMEKAKQLPDAVEGTVEKQEGQNKVTVPSISTSQPIDNFATNRISLIIRKSNPQFLPDDVKEDETIKNKISEGKCYSLLTAFPGNPDIPKASEWGGKFAVILPGQKPQVKAKPEQQAQNQPVSENKITTKISLNELKDIIKKLIKENEGNELEITDDDEIDGKYCVDFKPKELKPNDVIFLALVDVDDNDYNYAKDVNKLNQHGLASYQKPTQHKVLSNDGTTLVLS